MNFETSGSFMSAYVTLSIDDKDLRVKLDDVKKYFTKTAKDSEDAFNRLSKTVDSLTGRVVKLAAAYISLRGIKWLTNQAIEMENAIFVLGGTLKATGNYTKETIDKLLNFAESMQKVTVYSDREILSIMKMLNVLGVTGNQLRITTQWVIGLSDALGINNEVAARYVALALSGEYVMLHRYIPALRKASTETEKLQVFSEFANRAFEVSQARAQTTAGALKQMYNALIDVAEAIGAPLLPQIKASVIAIKDWALRNEENFSYWAQTSTAYITFVKDILWDLIKFFKTDWKAGLKLWVDISIELMNIFSESFVVIMAETGVRAFNALEKAFFRRFKSDINYINEQIDKLGRKALGIRPGAYKPYEPSALLPETLMGPEISKITEKRLDNISELIKTSNLDISEDAKKLTDRLIELEDLKAKGIIQREFDTTVKLLQIQGTVGEEQKKLMETLSIELADIQEKLVIRKLEERWKQFSESMRSSLESAFEGLILKGQDFRSFMHNLAISILEDFARIQFIKPLSESLSNIAGDILGSIGLGKIGFPITAPTTPVPVAHSGLTVGDYTSNRRNVSPFAFLNAKKYHGLKENEAAIIAEKGEVISRGISSGNININLQAIDTQSGIDFLLKHKDAIAAAFGKAMRKNNPVRRMGS